MQRIKADKRSLSVQVREHLLGLIRDGIYEPGERLPSEADLANRLGISRPTLREALLNLEQEGVIIRKHGVGTFVAPRCRHRLQSGLERLESVLVLAGRQGMQVGFDKLEVQEEPADSELAEKLQVAPGTPLTTVRRVIVVDEVPVAYMFDVAPVSILSPAEVDERFEGSVLDLLRQKQNLRIAQAVADIIAVNASPFLAEKLGIEPQQAVLLLEETLFNEEGQAVEFSRNYFIPAFFRFHVIRR